MSTDAKNDSKIETELDDVVEPEARTDEIEVIKKPSLLARAKDSVKKAATPPPERQVHKVTSGEVWAMRLKGKRMVYLLGTATLRMLVGLFDIVAVMFIATSVLPNTAVMLQREMTFATTPEASVFMWAIPVLFIAAAIYAVMFYGLRKVWRGATRLSDKLGRLTMPGEFVGTTSELPEGYLSKPKAEPKPDRTKKDATPARPKTIKPAGKSRR